MVGMMKQNLVMIVPNMLLMGWITYFFSGFILVKLPFPLTDRFKQMLQRGVSMGGLDVSYVSSLSWYFVNLFGLRGLFACVLGSDSAGLDNAEVMAQQMQGGMGQMGQVDPTKLYESVQHTHTHTHTQHVTTTQTVTRHYTATSMQLRSSVLNECFLVVMVCVSVW